MSVLKVPLLHPLSNFPVTTRSTYKTSPTLKMQVSSQKRPRPHFPIRSYASDRGKKQMLQWRRTQLILNILTFQHNYSDWTINISSPLFSIFSLAAILDGSRDHRTQFWKGAIQGQFHQSLVGIGLVVSEEKIKM